MPQNYLLHRNKGSWSLSHLLLATLSLPNSLTASFLESLARGESDYHFGKNSVVRLLIGYTLCADAVITNERTYNWLLTKRHKRIDLWRLEEDVDCSMFFRWMLDFPVKCQREKHELLTNWWPEHEDTKMFGGGDIGANSVTCRVLAEFSTGMLKRSEVQNTTIHEIFTSSHLRSAVDPILNCTCNASSLSMSRFWFTMIGMCVSTALVELCSSGLRRGNCYWNFDSRWVLCSVVPLIWCDT